MNDKCVLVYGAGKSGIAAANLLISHNAHVIIFDANESLDKSELMTKVSGISKEDIILGTLSDADLKNIDLALLSPGISVEDKYAVLIKNNGIKIIGEIELGFYFEKGRVLAITGTNGKTTTTTLLGEIIKHAGYDTHVVGNIGNPYTLECDLTSDESVTVLEISSFQLETIETFCPKVSAVLNITPDHLNRHHTMDNYKAAKMRIAENQSPDDHIVLNYEDEYLNEAAKDIKANVFFFSSKRELDRGIYLKDGKIIIKDKDLIELVDTNELKIIGEHNHENAMAAAAMAYLYGVDTDVIASALRSFTAVEHRIEYVDTVRGVRYYNDSKGTNPDAAIKAIKAMKWPTCLIAGGYDKDSDYTEWINSFDGKVKKMVLIGQTAQKIAHTCDECGFKDYVFADTYDEALKICTKEAKDGDAVLLSPACASWGMFDNFEQRGDMFKSYVKSLKE